MDKALLLGDEKKEIEVLEFTVGGNSYGIDINDIREILPYDTIPTRIPNSHPYIEGLTMPRDFLISVVNVAKSLHKEELKGSDREMLIVSSINNLNIAFHVDNVIEMHRTTTADVTKPGRKLSTQVKAFVVGILNIGTRKIELLDFKNIILEINSKIELG